jgi:type IV pilus assembly protein PilV
MKQVNQMDQQRGFVLIEAMIAMLIFSLGILGMVAMGGTAVSAQSDAQYRTEAANLANEISSTIALNVGPSGSPTYLTNLNSFQHQPGGTCGAFTGAPSANADVLAWISKASGAGSGLPGATATSQQIIVTLPPVEPGRVDITVCWRAPSDAVWRKLSLVTYVNQ